MASEADKYPESSSRRRFVKGVVGSASLLGLGVGAGSMVNLMTSPSGTGGGETSFFGIKNTAGPAPRAMPQIPIEIDEDGYLKGVYPTVETVERQGKTVKVAKMELGGITYSVNWFQYCGVQGYEGIDPEYDGDNYFRYASGSTYQWQNEEVTGGTRVHIDDFANYETWGNGIGKPGVGKPAMCSWRSQNTENDIPVQVLRSTLVEEMVNEASGDVANWAKASTQKGFIAWLDKCTHFCCVPGFKSTEQSAQFDAANKVYCPCHQSVYDPFNIIKQSFIAYPRPSEG
ncbi:MAG: ubiquinol-cytochrome c reductase iron-sulfur subunit [Halobacteriaceae archaeon]